MLRASSITIDGRMVLLLLFATLPRFWGVVQREFGVSVTSAELYLPHVCFRLRV